MGGPGAGRTAEAAATIKAYHCCDDTEMHCVIEIRHQLEHQSQQTLQALILYFIPKLNYRKLEHEIKNYVVDNESLSKFYVNTKQFY